MMFDGPAWQPLAIFPDENWHLCDSDMASGLRCEIFPTHQSHFDQLTRPQINGVIIYDDFFEFCKAKL